MGEPFFSDEKSPPTEQAILSALGKSASAWSALFDRLHAEAAPPTETWSYYRDGKSWLLKVSRKAKTLFWVSVDKGAFRVTFYFAERLTPRLLESDLPERLKTRIRDQPPIGKLRCVAVELGPSRGVGDVMALLELKKALR